MKKFLIILLFSAFFAIGCGGPGMIISPIVSGIVVWIEGEAHKYYGYNVEIMYRATKHALQKMNIPIHRDDTPKNNSYYIVAGKGDKFKIKIKNVENNITKVSIRINFMGDKPYTELIYKNIDDMISVIEFDSKGKPVKGKK